MTVASTQTAVDTNISALTAALTAYEATVNAQMTADAQAAATAATALAASQAATTAALTQASAYAAQVTAMGAEIASLLAKENPFLYGYDIGPQNSWAAQDALFGHVPGKGAARAMYHNSVPPPSVDFDATLLDGRDLYISASSDPVRMAAGSDNAGYLAYWNAIDAQAKPGTNVRFCWEHEVDAKLTGAQYVSGIKQLAPYMHSVKGGFKNINLECWGIVTAWACRNGNQAQLSALTPGVPIDGWGIDLDGNSQDACPDYSSNITNFMAWVAGMGCMAVAGTEFGHGRPAADTSGAIRLAWMQDTVSFFLQAAKAHNLIARSMLLWDGPAFPTLFVNPGTVEAAYWKSACQGNLALAEHKMSGPRTWTSGAPDYSDQR